MSHFIAHTISFSKDLTTFRVKGGDNNVVPRSNGWTSLIPTTELYSLVKGGSLKLQDNCEKSCFINHLVFNAAEDKSNYTLPSDTKEVQDIKGNFDENVLDKLVKGLNNLSNEKLYTVETSSGYYVYKFLKNKCSLVHNVENSRLFSKYVAIRKTANYSNFRITNEKIKLINPNFVAQ